MTTKPKTKSWREIHMAITAIAVTATLGMWNVFASPAKPQVSAQVTDTSTPPPPPPDPTDTAEPTSAALPAPTLLAFRPVKIIYGGLAPVQQVVQITATPAPAAVYSAPAPAKKRRSGGGGGGGSSAPAASSGSSKP